ncbi:MAG: glycosyltransferase family 4 protein [Candidatus Andersenbacteria bacterium]|nr:glycosyltransferase family 4 protein [Candidatus Andersenbacteria bacterium]
MTINTIRRRTVVIFSLNAYKVLKPASSAAMGGSEVQMVFLARHLLAKGYAIHFLVGNFGQPVVETVEGMGIWRTIKLIKGFKTYVGAPFILWWRLFQSAADVVISSPAGPEVGLIALYCRLFGKTYIFRTASQVDCTYGKIRDLGLIPGFFYKLGLLLAHTIVTQSEEGRAALWRYHRRHALVIHNLFEQVPPRHQGKLKEYVLWVGSARAVKQPHLFLELAAKLPHIKFCMILSQAGDLSLWHSIRDQATALPNIQFIGEVLLADIGAYMGRAKLLVGTSRYEGWPNVYLQAAAYGVPIVSLAVNPDNFLSVYKVGEACRGSFDELAAAVRRLWQGGDNYDQMVHAGPIYIAHAHAGDAIIKSWERLFAHTRPVH